MQPTSSWRTTGNAAPGTSRLAPGQGLTQGAAGRRPLPGGAGPAVSRRGARGRQLLMVTTAVRYGIQDPVTLVESCQQALVWLLRTTTARGQLIPRPWIDHPYGEEEITLLEEELLPAMEAFLQRVGEIDAALEADQEAAVQALAEAGRR